MITANMTTEVVLNSKYDILDIHHLLHLLSLWFEGALLLLLDIVVSCWPCGVLYYLFSFLHLLLLSSQLASQCYLARRTALNSEPFLKHIFSTCHSLGKGIDILILQGCNFISMLSRGHYDVNLHLWTLVDTVLQEIQCAMACQFPIAIVCRIILQPYQLHFPVTRGLEHNADTCHLLAHCSYACTK